MQIRPDILITVAGILIALAIPALVYHKVQFKHTLSSQETAVSTFTPSSLTIATMRWQDTTASIPVSAPPLPVPAAPPIGAKPPASIAGQASRAAATAQPAIPIVSLIISDGTGGGNAVLNGTPLRIGEQYKEWQLVRVESNRVLLRGRKGTIWVSQQ